MGLEAIVIPSLKSDNKRVEAFRSRKRQTWKNLRRLPVLVLRMGGPLQEEPPENFEVIQIKERLPNTLAVFKLLYESYKRGYDKVLYVDDDFDWESDEELELANPYVGKSHFIFSSTKRLLFTRYRDRTLAGGKDYSGELQRGQADPW